MPRKAKAAPTLRAAKPEETAPPAQEEEELREGILLGSPEEVAERIRALAESVGGELHFIARLYWPGMEPAVQREAMRVFAKEVIPSLR